MRPKGFSLIELMVTVAIIAVLSAVASLGYSQIRKNARDAQRQMVMKDMEASLELYRTANFGFIPAVTHSWQYNFSSLIASGYLKSNTVELEPLTNRSSRYTYTYCAGENNHKYLLVAFLEKPPQSQSVAGPIVSYNSGQCTNQGGVISNPDFSDWQANVVCGSSVGNTYVYCLGAL